MNAFKGFSPLASVFSSGNQNTAETPPPENNPQTPQENLPSDENNVDPIDGLWENKPAQKTEDNNQTVVVKNEPQEPTPAERLDSHIAGLNLTDGIDLGQVQADIQNGDTESLHAALQQVASNTYKQAINTSNQLMQNNINQVIETAVSKAVGATQSDAAVKQMETALPFTADPSVAPVAKGILGRFIKNGDDISTAIENTGKYFSKLNQLSTKDLGRQTPPSSSPAGDFNGSISLEAEGDDIDWLEALGGVQSNK